METEAIEHLRERVGVAPRVALILGSGLGNLADEVEGATRVPYESIPGFPESTVTGHAGTLVVGRWAGAEVAVMQGRFHLYEGWSSGMVALPIRVLAGLGAHSLVLTNAAGGVRPGMRPGDLMLIADHINLMWRNPLIGRVREGEERFPDMSDPYDAVLRSAAEEVALDLGIPLTPGVYAAVLGPSYETPAEIRMLARLGADAIGMSTVPEVLVARARGIRVLGISCITNLAAGLGDGEPLSHDEVVAVSGRVRDGLAALIHGVLPRVVASAARSEPARAEP